MHVAILGAGSLGRAFGVRLSSARVDVDFVVRAAPGEGPIRIEEVASGEALSIERPLFATAVPSHADVVLVCVPADRVEEAVRAAVDVTAASVPVVAMTPVLPETHARLKALAGARLVMAMSNVAAYTRPDGITRYWRARSTRLLIDEPRPHDPALTALVEALGQAGIEARFEPGVHETMAATLVLFLPIALGLDVAGTIDALLEDEPLLEATFDAADDARALAERCGKSAPWADLLTRFLGPRSVRMGLSLGRSRAGEAVAFVEEHFGRRMHAQNLVSGEEMAALAEAKGAKHGALDDLLARLREPSA